MFATHMLRDEHETILIALQGAEAEVNKIQKTGKVDIGKIEKIVDFIRNFADRCHHGKEEKLLFTTLEARGMPRDGGPIGVMLYEHDLGRSYVRAVIEAIPAAQNQDKNAIRAIAQNLSQFVSFLRGHIDKENNILYVMAEQMFSDEEQEALGEECRKIELQEMGPDVQEKYHLLAHEICGESDHHHHH